MEIRGKMKFIYSFHVQARVEGNAKRVVQEVSVKLSQRLRLLQFTVIGLLCANLPYIQPT